MYGHLGLQCWAFHWLLMQLLSQLLTRDVTSQANSKSKPNPNHELPIKSSSNLQVQFKSSPSQLSQVEVTKKTRLKSRLEIVQLQQMRHLYYATHTNRPSGQSNSVILYSAAYLTGYFQNLNSTRIMCHYRRNKSC